MGSEANIRKKSTKLPVQLYRAFFKLAIAAAIYAVFCIFKNGGDIKSASFAVAISVIGAVAYEVVYFIYKATSEESKSKEENERLKQVYMILGFFAYLIGAFLMIKSAEMICKGDTFAIASLAAGLALTQLMYSNKYISSRFSTFFESLVAAAVVITLEFMYYSLQLGRVENYIWIIGIGATTVFSALAELFFHFFNCAKHGRSEAKNKLDKLKIDRRKQAVLEKDGNPEPKPLTEEERRAQAEADKAELRNIEKQELKERLKDDKLILDRVIEFLRDILLVGAIWAIFAVLIAAGSVEVAVKMGIFDTAIAVIPIVISVATPVIDSQKQNSSKAFDKYDPRITKTELEKLLVEMFGKECASKSALQYVTDTLNKANGHKRYNGEDYFVHPIAVAMILLENTTVGDEVIAAALLHDCIEDVPGCTKEYIREKFKSDTIATYVDVLSKKPDVDYHNAENMWAYLNAIKEYPDAALIKIADRINNMNTLENCEKEVKLRKFRQTRLYYPKFVAELKEIDLKNGSKNKQFLEFAEKCFEEKKY